VSLDDSRPRTGPHEIGLTARLAAKKDEDSARRLYRKYRMELFRFGVRVLGNEGLAEEIAQETFIKFCQRARSYDSARGPVPAWLFTMVRRRPTTSPGVPPPGRSCLSRTFSCRPTTTALTKL